MTYAQVLTTYETLSNKKEKFSKILPTSNFIKEIHSGKGVSGSSLEILAC